MCAYVFSVLISHTVYIQRYNPGKHKLTGILSNSESVKSPEDKKCETCLLLQSIHSPFQPPIPRKMLFHGLVSLRDETGCSRDRGSATQTHQAAQAGCRHPTLRPTQQSPNPSQISCHPTPQLHPAELNTGWEISHCQHSLSPFPMTS